MKISDKIILYGILFAFLTFLCYLSVKNWAVAGLIAFLTLLLFRALFLYFYAKRKRKGHISVHSLEQILSVFSPYEQKEHFLTTFPKENVIETGENFIVYQKEQLSCIFFNYKFSPTSCDDVARFFRTARQKNVQTVIVLGRMPPRNVFVLARTLPLTFVFFTTKQVKKYLQKHNALPAPLPTLPKEKPNIKKTFLAAFSPERAKFFLGGSLLFSFYAFFGILRVWYAVFAGISMLCGIICLVRYFREQS